MVAPLVLMLAPIVVPVVKEAVCWCIGWWRNRHTTTTTETPTTTTTTTPDPAIAIRAEQKRVFFLSANAYLDEISRAVGTVSVAGEGDFGTKLDALRSLTKDRLTKVTTVFARLGSFTSVDFDPSRSVALTFEIIQKLNSAKAIENWPETQLAVTSALSDIRSDLFTFAINSQ
jgi:hypothetical protein